MSDAVIDLTTAYKLRVLNKLTYAEIGQQFGVTKQSVHAALQRFAACLPDSAHAQAYETARPALLGAVEEQLLASLTDPAKLEKASLNNIAYAFQQVHTARRLESGQSTQNLAVLSKIIEDADGKLFPKPARPVNPPAK